MWAEFDYCHALRFTKLRDVTFQRSNIRIEGFYNFASDHKFSNALNSHYDKSSLAYQTSSFYLITIAQNVKVKSMLNTLRLPPPLHPPKEMQLFRKDK